MSAPENSHEPASIKDGTRMELLSRKSFFLRVFIVFLSILLALTSLVGCTGDTAVRIGITPQMSTRLIGYMIKELAGRQGIDCEIVEVPGGIYNLQPALESGSLQIGTELAQSAWNSVLNKRSVYRASNLLELQHYYLKHDLQWNPLPMGRDVYTLAIRKDLAMKENIKTISDLIPLSDSLTLGAPTQYFEDADGYPRLSKTYGMSFGTTKNLPTELLAQNLRDRKADVIPIHTLDGLLQRDELVVLRDDLDSCPGSELGIVIDESALLKHIEFADIIDSLARTVDSQSLVFYNRLVVYNHRTEEEAALQFLKAHNLIVEDPADAGKTREELEEKRTEEARSSSDTQSGSDQKKDESTDSSSQSSKSEFSAS